MKIRGETSTTPHASRSLSWCESADADISLDIVKCEEEKHDGDEVGGVTQRGNEPDSALSAVQVTLQPNVRRCFKNLKKKKHHSFLSLC